MRLTPISCLLIIYAVGVAGMLTPWAKDFILLTPFNLVASLAFLIWGEENKNGKIWLALVLAGVAGWAVEAVGTNTGLLFGDYSYGGTLGWKIAETPIMMAVNWAMLIYIVISICNYFIFSWQQGLCRRMVTAIIGATLMVSLDFLIEPAAVAFDFWRWEISNGNSFFVAPMQNYLAWWGISWVLIFGLQPLFIQNRNAAAAVLLLLQFVFFALLNII
jgi:bisanhydrobacterioruberin hydratase